MKKKVCKKCRIVTKTDKCPICNGTDLTTSWNGRIIIINHEKSEIAKKININVDENLVVMKHIYTDYGEHKSKVIVNVYKDANILKKLDTKKVKKVNENAEKKEKAKETK